MVSVCPTVAREAEEMREKRLWGLNTELCLVPPFLEESFSDLLWAAPGMLEGWEGTGLLTSSWPRARDPNVQVWTSVELTSASKAAAWGSR